MQVTSIPSFISPRATSPTAAPKEEPRPATPAATPGARPAPRFAVSRLAALMNMSAPERPALGESLISPHAAMAFQIVGGNPQGGVHPNSQARHFYPTGGPTDASTAGLVQDMLDELGDGEQITLDDAREALFVPSGALVRNSDAKIEEYFDRLDRNDSGALERSELMFLLKHYQDWDRSQGKPRLPSTWA